MYKRKTKLSPLHISLIALAILVVIAVIVTFAVKKDEPKEPTAQSGIVYDDSAIEGGWETLSQEEIEQRLNDKVQAGMISFYALCTNLTSGLPAEIAARQKQYEYYRDKLLTFKEKME